MNGLVDLEAIGQMRDAVRGFAKEVDGVGRVRTDAAARATGMAPDDDELQLASAATVAVAV